MPYVIDYDQPICLYKLNPNGETADILPVLGKKAYDNAVEEGWSEHRPNLRYPTTMYQDDGQTKIAHSSAEDELLMRPHLPTCQMPCRLHGWHHTVTAAPPAPPENYGPLVEAASDTESVSLALKLMEEQEKRHAMEQEMTLLKQQIAETLALMREKPAKGKPGRKPNPKPAVNE